MMVMRMLLLLFEFSSIFWIVIQWVYNLLKDDFGMICGVISGWFVDNLQIMFERFLDVLFCEFLDLGLDFADFWMNVVHQKNNSKVALFSDRVFFNFWYQKPSQNRL